MDLEIRHLQLVAGIARDGSMTRTANSLHLTQSALSHQLRDIEARFKTPFFLRVGKRMVLTAAGRRVLESATRILDELARVEEDVRRIAGDGEGIIRVATQCNTGYHWLPPLLAAFNRKHPRVNISIRPDNTDRPVQALLEGEIDLAILTDEPSDRRLRLRRLFADEMIALVTREHRFATRTWISPRELAAEHLLLYSSSPDDSFVLKRVLGPAGLVPNRLSFIMLTEAMIEMARAGLGVAVLPRWSAQPAIATRTVVPLSLTRRGIRRHWTAATLKAQTMSPWLDDFITLVAERALPAQSADSGRRTA
ncbi:MAG TPA: LysR family transcriptional regulator [Vicinamibacterales bacterium]|jgi:LysR family transcriptional regulator, regulator for metE and metH|nr:LysR family transcriptional regulator [Vicinamibacterales bacterium]